jgi:hypothetical protein
MVTHDALIARRQEMADQTAAAEAARKANVETFTRMWLTLGPDVLKLAGTMHDGEIAQAKGIAAARWGGLIGMEQQAEREEATLASRPKKRPSSAADDLVPDRVLERQDRDWIEKTRYLQTSLADLRQSAATERQDLESYTAKTK